jgi:hypothetical protein
MPGPASPPLYPAADPNVIAVTAPTSTTNLFRRPTAARTSRSRRPASTSSRPRPRRLPDAVGHLVRGAQVSGIAALLIERNPQARCAAHPPHPDDDRARSRPGRHDDSSAQGLRMRSAPCMRAAPKSSDASGRVGPAN